MILGLTPQDHLIGFGMPWHGVMAESGTFSPPTGPSQPGIRPKMADGGEQIDFTRRPLLVKFSGVPTPPTLDADAVSAGKSLKDHAILAGHTRQYSPLANFFFGVDTWLYRSPDKTVWVMRLKFTSTNMFQVEARKLNASPATSFAVLASAFGTDYTANSQIFGARPDGSLAVVNAVNATINMAAWEISVNGGDNNSPPTANISQGLYRTRNVTVTSQETWLGVCFGPDATRRDVFHGSEILPGNASNRQYWYVIGADRFEAGRYTLDNATNTWTATDFNGAVYSWSSLNPDHTPNIQIYHYAYLAVAVYMQIFIAGSPVWKIKFHGALGTTRYVDFAGATPPASLNDFVEHPVTGEFVTAHWIF